MKKVYIACPYTVGDVGLNVRTCIDVANKVAERGDLPFAPLLFHFWHIIYPHDYEFWMKQSISWMKECDLCIRLPGESAGADREVELAVANHIPVLSLQEYFLNGN